jgi:energy-coupling factor transporter transmembrane protein EcfT
MHSSYFFAHQNDPETAAIIISMIILIAVVIFFALLMTILVVWSFCRIFKKAEYSWAWGLLWLVPVGNVITPLILAFGDWPIHKEMQKLKGQAASTGGVNPTVV